MNGKPARPKPKAPKRPTAAAPSKSALFAPPLPRGVRIGLYGPGGIGKTTLSVQAPGPVALFDLDDSWSQVMDQFPASIDVRVIAPVISASWKEIIECLNNPGWDEIRTVIVDSATRAEELALEHTLATVPVGDKAQTKAVNIESYGYGKGFQYLFDTFMELLHALAIHSHHGRNVILICHDCVTKVPNPLGEDWIRYEPRLQSPNSGKASIRLRVREWVDHLLFMGYDINVNKEGKAEGSSTRTIYPVELPHCMAKSRRLAESVPVEGAGDAGIWDQLFKEG